MIVVIVSYGLNPPVYIDTGGARVTRSRLQWEEIFISVLPSLLSTPRRVPSGHGTKSSILYLHSPTVWPKDIVWLSGYPLIQDSLNPSLNYQSISVLPEYAPLRKFFVLRHLVMIRCDRLYVQIQRVKNSCTRGILRLNLTSLAYNRYGLGTRRPKGRA